MYGKQRGVQDHTIVTMRVWYNPWTDEIYQSPTFLRNVMWILYTAPRCNRTK